MHSLIMVNYVPGFMTPDDLHVYLLTGEYNGMYNLCTKFLIFDVFILKS